MKGFLLWFTQRIKVSVVSKLQFLAVNSQAIDLFNLINFLLYFFDYLFAILQPYFELIFFLIERFDWRLIILGVKVESGLIFQRSIDAQELFLHRAQTLIRKVVVLQ